MGTTYRVVLARDIPGLGRGELHREIEAVLARLDRQTSTWRADSDVTRFNRAGAGEWVVVGDDLVRIVETARRVHAETNGVFDITVAPLARLWAAEQEPGDEALAAARELVGMPLVESRVAAAGRPAALRKARTGVTLDLGGIGPGYGVDRVGEHLAALGSRDHLVELGGEVRAWGGRIDGEPWRVEVRAAADGAGEIVALRPGEAIAFCTVRFGRGPIDPRTGRPVAAPIGTVHARSDCCACADGHAVARAVVSGSPQ
jgi:thiamine biosynthesis lipoprotein